jgi:hypothetical protein
LRSDRQAQWLRTSEYEAIQEAMRLLAAPSAERAAPAAYCNGEDHCERCDPSRKCWSDPRQHCAHPVASSTRESEDAQWVRNKATGECAPIQTERTFADWWDTIGRARFQALPIRDPLHAAKIAWEAATSVPSATALDYRDVIYNRTRYRADGQRITRARLEIVTEDGQTFYVHGFDYECQERRISVAPPEER